MVSCFDSVACIVPELSHVFCTFFSGKYSEEGGVGNSVRISEEFRRKRTTSFKTVFPMTLFDMANLKTSTQSSADGQFEVSDEDQQ